MSLSLPAAGIRCPWNLDTLYATPSWGYSSSADEPDLQELHYDSLSFKGEKVQVFAYYGVPAGPAPAGGWPAVVCVHGGGGTAFAEWVRRWNQQGYAAISMDLEGHLPVRENPADPKSPRIPTAHPGPERVGVFNDFAEPIEEQWYYHAVAQVVLAHSLIRSFLEVNAAKTGITGISWGGTLTSTVMGLDNRFKFAIPVYGCGYLPDSDGHQGETIQPGRHSEVVWENYDGSAYFTNVTSPTLWVNGTNDMHFPMPSTQASAQAVAGAATLRFALEMPHGHGPGWKPEEIYAFADSVVKGSDPLVAFGQLRRQGSMAAVGVTTARSLSGANLLYTTETGPWPKRKWESKPAEIFGDQLRTEIPVGAVAFFFSATDDRGLMTSSAFMMIEEKLP